MAKFSYIHIPFCKSKCNYCAFTSYVNLNFLQDYINALTKEILFKYDKTPLKTLYFGGGTPSLSGIKQVESILNLFNFENKPEITFEINPEDAKFDYLADLMKIGINRVSIGVESFDDEILKFANRRHNKKQALLAVENAKKAGFTNISIDLIYGLDGQDLNNWLLTLKTAKSLDVEHISTYGLKIEDKTYYAKFPPKNAADDDMQAEMYDILCEELSKFYHYEISNFAKDKNFISKHNMNYWNIEPYSAFGVSASGFEGDIRYKNTTNLKKYLLNPIESNEEKIKLTKQDLLEETIFLGFRKCEGIDISSINKRFDIDFDKKYEKIISKYINTGHIEKTEKGYRLTQSGILISNCILCDFLC